LLRLHGRIRIAQIFYIHYAIIGFMKIRGIYFFLILLFLLSPLIIASTSFVPSVFASNGESITVHFIDVGQGDSIFIDTSGLDVLVDGGPRTAGHTVVEYLGKLSITKIDLMVATHMDADHIGGLISVLNSTIQIDEVLINNQTGNTATYSDFISLANTHSVEAAQRGDTYILTQNVNLTVLNPVQPLEFTSQNENSVVMRLQIGQSSFLLMGDAQSDAEESIMQCGLEINSDVLKVGHHGSNSSTTEAFLNAVSPSIAIISAGENNQYGHPHQETLDKLFAHGIVVYGTYESGSIVVTADSTFIEIQDEPQPIPELSSLTILVTLAATVLIFVIYEKNGAEKD
jgi:competence protein ComEC